MFIHLVQLPITITCVKNYNYVSIIIVENKIKNTNNTSFMWLRYWKKIFNNKVIRVISDKALFFTLWLYQKWQTLILNGGKLLICDFWKAKTF